MPPWSFRANRRRRRFPPASATSQVTASTVERILRRDFDSREVKKARSALGVHVGADLRKQLAVLKQSRGSLELLKYYMSSADIDPRDVIAWAESPRQMGARPGDPEPTEGLVEQDRLQYAVWLEADTLEASHASSLLLAGYFNKDQIQTLNSLVGQEVTGWRGVEMAIREEGPTGPVFKADAVPCLQFVHLDLQFTEPDHAIRIVTCQDDDEWGISLSDVPDSIKSDKLYGIYRDNEPENLPIGIIENVSHRLSERGNLCEIDLKIAGQHVLLIAGEIHETHTVELRFVYADESILVFEDPSDASRIDWVPPRTSWSDIEAK